MTRFAVVTPCGSMDADFRAAAQRIEASPLGRLMYGQRELFHSNLLAWFFDALPEAADETTSPTCTR